eukprot:scaffold9603_cov65-Phaeocystis_antarctica.AAC.2
MVQGLSSQWSSPLGEMHATVQRRRQSWGRWRRWALASLESGGLAASRDLREHVLVGLVQPALIARQVGRRSEQA